MPRILNRSGACVTSPCQGSRSSALQGRQQSVFPFEQGKESYSGTSSTSLPSAARCMIFSSVASARFNSPEIRP
jgi:hypothetical protein